MCMLPNVMDHLQIRFYSQNDVRTDDKHFQSGIILAIDISVGFTLYIVCFMFKNNIES